MKSFPTAFKCTSVNKNCPWFTVGKDYDSNYRDDGVFIYDDGDSNSDDKLLWKLTKAEPDLSWNIETCHHIPKVIATFTEVHAEEE